MATIIKQRAMATPPGLHQLWRTILRVAVGASVVEFLFFLIYVPSLLILLLFALIYAGISVALFYKDITTAAKTARGLAFFLFPATTVSVLRLIFADRSAGGAAPVIWLILTALTQLIVIIASSELVGSPVGGAEKLARRRKLAERFLVGLIVVSVFVVVGTILFPGGLSDPGDRAKYQALYALRQVHGCVMAYQSANPDTEYPSSMDDIGAGGSGCVDAAILSASPSRSYDFVYTPSTSNTLGVVPDFTVTATRTGAELAAKANYFVDWTGTIRYTEEDREATVDDPPVDP